MIRITLYSLLAIYMIYIMLHSDTTGGQFLSLTTALLSVGKVLDHTRHEKP